MIILPKRIDLMNLLPYGASVIEVGVRRAEFSVEILNLPNIGKLYLCDPWSVIPGYDDPANTEADHESNLKIAMENIKPFRDSDRVEVLRMDSLTAFGFLNPLRFDCVYLDADHSRRAVYADLVAWQNRVKPGGYLMGHDYSNSSQAREWKIEVIPAVTQFCEETDWRLTHLTEDKDVLPSFALQRA